VGAEELKRYWFSPAATSMVEDHQRRVRIVRMDDGTEFECPFAEIRRLAGHGSADRIEEARDADNA
jgi:hypothetical protein